MINEKKPEEEEEEVVVKDDIIQDYDSVLKESGVLTLFIQYLLLSCFL